MKIYSLIFLSAFLLISCSSKKSSEAADIKTHSGDQVQLSAAQVKQAGIETGKAEWREISSEIKVNGLVDVPPQNIVSVSFPLGGYLKSTQLLPGMPVRRGETIAVIEDQSLVQLQQDYLVAKARLTFLQQEYERQKLLNESKVNADKLFQQAEADYQSQKVLVKGYSEKLRLIGMNPEKLNEGNISRSVPLLSPINGFVSKVNVNIGKYVTATDVLFELINPDDMHATLTVFEKDINKVKVGQQVSVTFVDDPATVYACEVLLVTRNVDDSRSALVHCHFEKQPDHLLPGMFLSGLINVSNSKSLVLPEGAITRYGNKNYAVVMNGSGNYSLQEVTTGIQSGGFVEIVSPPAGFDAQTYVTRNAYAVLSQMKNTAGDE